MRRLHAAADVVEVEQLVLAEREARSYGWWRAMADCYHDDARVSLGWFTGTAAEFADQVRAVDAAGVDVRLRIGPPAVHLNGTRAVASVAGTLRVGGPPSVGRHGTLRIFHRLLYRVEKRHQAWRIVAMDGIVEQEDVDSHPRALDATPTPPTDPPPALALRAPRLAAYLAGLGVRVDADLMAEDDDAMAVATRYREIFDWAGLAP